jgi:hypothetical protein
LTRREAIVSAAKQVAPLFAHHGWKWGMEDDAKIPTEADIAMSFTEMVGKMERDAEIIYISGGRLGVQRRQQEEGWPDLLRLTLDLEEYEVEG